MGRGKTAGARRRQALSVCLHTIAPIQFPATFALLRMLPAEAYQRSTRSGPLPYHVGSPLRG